MKAMTCQELTGRLLDFHGGDVDRAGLRAIEAHLTVCDPCLRYLCDYELTIRLAQSAAGRGAGLRLQ